MPETIGSVARSGFAGVGAVYLTFFGVFLLFPGCILLGTSFDSNFQSDFFEDSNRGKRIAGSILLPLGCIFIIVGIVLCVYVCKTLKRSNEAVRRAGPFATGPVVSGSQPPPVSGHFTQQAYPLGPGTQPHPSQPGYPAGYSQPAAPQPYPSQYPAGYPQGPAAGGYPAQGGYAPPSGYPAQQYPPSQDPTMGEKPGVEPTAPPSYFEATTK